MPEPAKAFIEPLAGDRRLFDYDVTWSRTSQRLEGRLRPLYDQVGGYQRTWIGYQGTRQTLFDLANILLTREKGEIRPYRSRLSQKGADQWPGASIGAV